MFTFVFALQHSQWHTGRFLLHLPPHQLGLHHHVPQDSGGDCPAPAPYGVGNSPAATASFPCTSFPLLLWTTSFTLATLATLAPAITSAFPCQSDRRRKAILSLYVVDFTFCVAVVFVSYVMIAQTLRKNTQVRKCPAVITVDASRPQPFMRPCEGGGEPISVPYRLCTGTRITTNCSNVQTHGYTKSPKLQPLRPAGSSWCQLSMHPG